MQEVSSDELTQIGESYGVKTSFIYIYIYIYIYIFFFFLVRFRPIQKFLQSIFSQIGSLRCLVYPYLKKLPYACLPGWRHKLVANIDGDRQDSARDILQTSAKGLYHDIAQCPSAASGQRCITIRITARNTTSSHTGEGK